MNANPTALVERSSFGAFAAGAGIGTLGGLVGLGGAEFRLPVLLGAFRFSTLEAVVLNKALSLVVVAFALPLRASAVPLADVMARWDVMATLLSGSLFGAWVGASWATRLSARSLNRVIAVLLAVVAVVLVAGHTASVQSQPVVQGGPLLAAGVAAGWGIGVVAALLGVAGGELLIPTIVLLFGVDLKLAGSLSLAVSLPTMLMAFARYSQDRSFAVLARERRFFIVMAAGSLVGAAIGGQLLGVVPVLFLLPLLAGVLALSAIRQWRHA